jgi:hypothetical protein
MCNNIAFVSLRTVLGTYVYIYVGVTYSWRLLLDGSEQLFVQCSAEQ